MTVSLVIEVPESLHQATQKFLDARPDWDQERLMQAAMSLFLMQMPDTADRIAASQLYMNAMLNEV